MNHETLEQAAIRYASEKIETRYPIDAREDFKAGAKWREQQAAGGFDEWQKDFIGEAPIGNGNTKWQRDAWQASQLSNANLLAEKDKEIEKLKQRIEELDYCQKAFYEATKKVGW